MAPSSINIYIFSFLTVVGAAFAGFKAGSGQNVAVYWGQNSGEAGQERLAYYCDNSSIDIINLAFINSITPVTVNFASATNKCTTSRNSTGLFLCKEIEEDIKACQKKGKTILISMGGATSPIPRWNSTSDAEKSARLIWDMFGPWTANQVDRPFGTAVVDGFDFDFETPISNLPAFGAELRHLMDDATNKFYLSAAPQCVYPDANIGTTLDAVPFDIVQVQFYNNACGINQFQGDQDQPAFNFPVWDDWAQKSKNPNVKVLLGIPASTDAANSESYTSDYKLAAAFDWTKKFPSFGGVMMWDAAQLYANSGFLQEVIEDLRGSNQSRPYQTPTSATSLASSLQSSSSPLNSPSLSATTIPQWGQCGGQGYAGSTQCQAPYHCTYYSQWWSDCR